MPTKPFLDVPGYTGRGLKGGSTVLKKSREQRSGTFTPNKRDPSEFITVPNAGATQALHKATEPSHLKCRGFHKESCCVLPSPACSTAQGWPIPAQSTAGSKETNRGQGHRLSHAPEPFKRGGTPVPGDPGAGGPLQGWEALEMQLFPCEQPIFRLFEAEPRPPPRGKRLRNLPAEPSRACVGSGTRLPQTRQHSNSTGLAPLLPGTAHETPPAPSPDRSLTPRPGLHQDPAARARHGRRLPGPLPGQRRRSRESAPRK